MRKSEACALREQLVVDLRNSAVHRIGGRHRRQADEETVRAARHHQPVGKRHRRLGLAGPGHVLQQMNLRPLHQSDRRSPFLQRRRSDDVREEFGKAQCTLALHWQNAARVQSGSGLFLCVLPVICQR